LTRAPTYTGQFRRDLKLAKKRGKDMEKLRTAMTMLIDSAVLPPEYNDHPLRGEWKPSRDFHIEPDWILIYSADDETVLFERTGTHADLFG